jgi:hypothetical protein
MGLNDWAAVGTIASAFASFLTLSAAWQALRIWKLQIRYDVGRRYRILLYRLRDVIINSLESEASAIDLNCQIGLYTEDKGSGSRSPSPRLLAWESHWDDASSKCLAIKQQLEAIGYEVESIWGSGFIETMDDLNQLVLEITGRMYEFAALSATERAGSTFDNESLRSMSVDESGRLIPEFTAKLKAAIFKAESIVNRPNHPRRRSFAGV